METADPLNPSSKADAAEDLIEELARLMADDAQINAPTPAPVGANALAPRPIGQLAPKPGQAKSPAQTPAQSFAFGQGAQQEGQQGAEQGTQQGTGQQNPKKPDTQNQASPSNAEPKPLVGNFDLGQPQAEVSPVPAPAASVPAQSAVKTSVVPETVVPQTASPQVKLDTIEAAIADATQAQDASSVKSAEKKLDFDFGFGVGPEDAPAGGTAPINMPVNADETQSEPTPVDTHITNGPAINEPAPTKPAPLGPELATQEGDDPIAALINAAVTKHSGVDTSAEMSAAELAIADMPLQNDAPPPNSDADVPDAHVSNADVPYTDISNADDFVVPPIFGIEGVASAPVDKTPVGTPFHDPIGGSSALDDIEALIGNSVNVSSSSAVLAEDISAQQAVEGPALAIKTSPAERPAPASIAPMSGTPDASVANSANPEASILQAMAGAGVASGATQARSSSAPGGGVAHDQAEPTLAAGRVKTQSAEKKGLPKILVPMLGVLFLGAAGVAGYMYFNQPQQNADAPILLADTTPTRTEPAPVETAEQSVVLNEIDGASTPAQDEQLVSRDETDGATGAVVRQVITEDNSEAGLANRRVRTVTVRPDGTIVSGDDTAAGSQVLPVAQPNLPDLPTDAVNTELSNTTVAALPESANELAIQNPNLVTVNGDSVPFPQPALTNRAALRSAAVASETQLPVTTGVSTSTETNTETNVVNLINDAATSTLPTTPVNVAPEANVAATPAPTTTLSNPQAYVQLASQRSQSVANQTASTMQSRYSSALNGGSLLVRRVDLGTRGIYYRVQLPTSSLSEANSICNAIKSAGGDCFTRNS